MKVLTLTHAQAKKLHGYVLKLKRGPQKSGYVIPSKAWRSLLEELTEEKCHIYVTKADLDVMFSRLHNYLMYKKARGLVLEHEVSPGKFRRSQIGAIHQWDFVAEPGMQQARRS